MRCRICNAGLFAIVVLFSARQSYAIVDDVEANIDSPRIAALAKQLNTVNAVGNREACANFWQEIRGKAPLVEAVANDPHSSWVTYVWHGNSETRRIALIGGPNSPEPDKWLTRLSDTDVWYRTEKTPNVARFLYRFHVNRVAIMPMNVAAQEKIWKDNPPQPDPLNSQLVVGERGSLVELCDVPPQPWMRTVPGASARVSIGISRFLTQLQVTEFKLKSTHLQAERDFAVYVPPRYDLKGEPCNLLVMFDGNGCRQGEDNSLPVPVILDNLIQAKKLPPIVAVFVYQTAERDKELACSASFADFVALELVPWVQQRYHVTRKPERAIVCGLSLGGLMSSYCGLRHSEVFGNVLSLSGSYPWFPGAFEGTAAANAEPGWLTRQFVSSAQLPIRFYVTAGQFENFYPLSLLGENRRFRDVLKAKGYEVKYSEFCGGHDSVGWRTPLVEGLLEPTSAAKPAE